MSNDWEIVQEKVPVIFVAAPHTTYLTVFFLQAFTAWVNGVLKHINEKVTDITQDFSDGVRLAHFLELLSGKKMPKKAEEAKSRIHKINNVFLALQFLEQMDVKVEGVAAEGIKLALFNPAATYL
jgi:hypothetical protein